MNHEYSQWSSKQDTVAVSVAKKRPQQWTFYSQIIPFKRCGIIWVFILFWDVHLVVLWNAHRVTVAASQGNATNIHMRCLSSH